MISLLIAATIAAPYWAEVPMPQLMGQKRLANYRAMIPKLDDESLNIELQRACIYTEREIPRVYQHEGGVHNPNYNISGGTNEFGQRETVGNAAQEFPWRHPFGADGARAGSFKGLSLPGTGEGIWPICYWFDGAKYRLCHPSGTTYFEVLTTTDPQGYSRPWEVRVRTRYKDHWDVDVFRPVTTWHQLRDLIEDEPAWQQDKMLLAAHTTITSNPQYRWAHLRNKHARPIIRQSGWLEEVPPLPPAFVTKLLTRTFQSAIEEPWRTYTDGNGPTHGPSTRSAYSIVSPGHNGGLVKVSSESCNRCHTTTNVDVDVFGPQARDWYGRTPGSDGAFSSLGHLFARGSISGNGARLPVTVNRTRIMFNSDVTRANDPRYQIIAGVQ